MLAECDEPYRYINTDIKYSYAILRKDKLAKHFIEIPVKSKFARLSQIEKHNKKRINVAGSVMSGDLGDEKYMLFRVCDGTSKKAVYAVIPAHNLSEDNEVLHKSTIW